ncbi:hypothetical protein GQ464_001220 [Rhodocaloribacter litoris]|uniref:ABC transporter permease n=1 Tax=Rhodocaloribacter litoris TaxID=2558931 RepID=UPI0014206426|nr:ABC transporter permease [Rhodocaloribacter litoris]QXD15593.1 hypothetical protein GQ464_001220 [Rhodocaloribacter litoris]
MFRTGHNDRPGALGLALFILIALLPIGFSLGYAFAYSVGLTGLLSEGPTGRHWAQLLREGEIWASFGLSLYVAAATVVLGVSGALLLVLYLRRPLRRGVLAYLIYLPLALPATVTAFLTYQVLSSTGYLARWLLALGLLEEASQLPGLVNDAGGVGIIAAHVGMAVPFFTLLFLHLYDSEKLDALTDLARTLGAGRRACLYRVTVPILLARARPNIVLLFIFVLGSYEIPLLLGRQAPQMVSVLAMRKYALFDLTEKPEAFIIALLYTALVLLLLIAGMRDGTVFRRGRETP